MGAIGAMEAQKVFAGYMKSLYVCVCVLVLTNRTEFGDSMLTV